MNCVIDKQKLFDHEGFDYFLRVTTAGVSECVVNTVTDLNYFPISSGLHSDILIIDNLVNDYFSDSLRNFQYTTL